LDRVFPSLKERGILQVTDRPPHRNQRTAWLSETSAGHHDHVSSLVVSPNGRSFASSSYDSTIVLWNAHQGTIEHEWVGHDGYWVNSLTFSPDSRYLLSGGDDGTLQVWDTLDGRVKQVQVLGAAGGTEDSPDLDRHDGCGWSADGMWIASRFKTGTVHLWDGRSFHWRRTFEEPATASCRPSFSPDSRWLVWSAKLSKDSAEYFCVWDALALDASPRRLPAHPDDAPTHILSFNPSSKCLVTAVHGPHLRVWDVITGAQLAVMEGHSFSITTASFSPDGRHILSASHDGTAKVWNAKSGECTLSLEGHKDRVDHARFSPDGNYIATASNDTTVRLWRSGDGSCLATFTEHEKLLTYIVLSPDGKRLASGDIDGVVHIRDISHIIGQ
ncbi:HET-E, partial [Ganoderma leucocontextum]